MSRIAFEPFVAIDFETWDAHNETICSVGLAIVDAPDQIRTIYHRVRPASEPGGLFQFLKHRLTSRELSDQVPWPVVWAELWPHIEGRTVFAHNASFDRTVLENTNRQWGIEPPDIPFRCSMDLAGGGRLDELCRGFGVPLTHHHRADHDALACARLVLHLMGCGAREGSPAHPPPSTEERCSDIHPNDRIPYDSPAPRLTFPGQTFCFTGGFVYDRDRAIAQTEALGGIVKKGMSGKVRFLVVGRNGNDFWSAGDSGGSKVAKALELKSKGKAVAIVPECVWAAAVRDALGGHS